MKKSTEMPFGRKNYTAMLAGIGLILLGFIIMSIDSEEFGFGFMGLTLGPIVLFSGFLVEIAAIFIKDDVGNELETVTQDTTEASILNKDNRKTKKR